jgi:hypothetical protein
MIRELRQLREKAAPCRGHDFQVKNGDPTAKKALQRLGKSGLAQKKRNCKSENSQAATPVWLPLRTPDRAHEREAFGLRRDSAALAVKLPLSPNLKNFVPNPQVDRARSIVCSFRQKAAEFPPPAVCASPLMSCKLPVGGT